MRLSGVEFFPNRTELQKQRSLDEQLGSADAIDLVTIIGRTLHETQLKNIKNIKRVIFPNPDSPSAEDYARSVNETGFFKRQIAETTKSLQRKAIEGSVVFTHDQAIFYDWRRSKE
jgi:hypothetical protein